MNITSAGRQRRRTKGWRKKRMMMKEIKNREREIRKKRKGQVKGEEEEK